MSSPAPDSNINNSQVAHIIDEHNETPNTTPPVFSRNATPGEEVEMAVVNETEDNATDDGVKEKEAEAADEDEDDEDEEEEETLSLPLSKIKRIFKMDSDYLAASQSAVYATGLATELFIQYFTEQALVLAKMDKRKKLQYKDFSNAVAGQDSLYFLSDTVPKTQPIGELISKKKINANEETNEVATTEHNDEGEMEVDEPVEETKKLKPLAKGQQTLNFGSNNKNPVPMKKAVIDDLMTADDSDMTSKEATVDLEDQDVIMTN